MSAQAWEFLFMMLALKIPIVYLGAVVYWAIKAVPEEGEEPEPVPIWKPWQHSRGPRPRRGGPHGRNTPSRSAPARRDRVAP